MKIKLKYLGLGLGALLVIVALYFALGSSGSLFKGELINSTKVGSPEENVPDQGAPSSLNFKLSASSPSGNVILNDKNVVLARYDVEATGEQMKVENLSVATLFDDDQSSDLPDFNDADGDAFTLQNGMMFLDGVQVGPTMPIASQYDLTQGYTTFDFGSSFIVTPGTSRVLEIRADIFDNDGINGLDGTMDALKTRILVGSSNVQKMISLDYITSPDVAISSNILDVKVGYLDVVKNSTYPNNTITPPKSPFLLGKFNIQASPVEDVTITNVIVDPEGYDEDAYDASDDLKNMYIKIGDYKSSIIPTVDDAYNLFSPDLNITVSTAVPVEVWADVAASATDGDSTADIAAVIIKVAWKTVKSGISDSSAFKVGQTITFSSEPGPHIYKSWPTLTQDVLPDSSLVNGKEQDLYKFKVAASPQGDISLKQFILNTTWSDAGMSDALEIENWKLYEDGADITSNVTLQDEDGSNVESTFGLLESDSNLIVSWDFSKESVIKAGTRKTYTLRGTPQGFNATRVEPNWIADSVSFKLADDNVQNGANVYLNGTATDTDIWGLYKAVSVTGSGELYKFIWSDNSATPHTAKENASSSGDWANGYLLEKLGEQKWVGENKVAPVVEMTKQPAKKVPRK